MLLIDCPWCGPRPEIEFRYAGEAHVVRAERPSDVRDEDWAHYLYYRRNPMGPHAERWYHAHGCGRYLNALRDTRTDRLVATYRPGEPRPESTE
jgi:sarcosine oxidase subunit delta